MNSWIIVPAAGVGKRFGGDIPKQYLDLAGKMVIEHTLERLLSLEPAGIVVAVSGEDNIWHRLPVSSHPLVRTVTGGEERSDSVRLALRSLANDVSDDQWVLVHDVARPCVTTADITNLADQLANAAVGGILAAPVSDTLKRSDGESKVVETVNRSGLWAAMTPQMFRYGVLLKALEECHRQGISPTDEAMAVEMLGLRPQLVEGRRDNIKITRREDMAIAETILRRQSGE